MARIRTKYEITSSEVAAGDSRLTFLCLADEDLYLEQLVQAGRDGPVRLPFWIKVWPADVILAHTVARLDAPDGGRALELKAGLGVSGLFAAAKGWPVTMWTDNPDASDFIRAETLINGLAGVELRQALDEPGLKAPYDLILASDTSFPRGFDAELADLLRLHLAPGGQALLAEDYKKKTPELRKHLGDDLLWSEKHVALRGPGEVHPIMLYRIKWKT